MGCCAGKENDFKQRYKDNSMGKNSLFNKLCWDNWIPT